MNSKKIRKIIFVFMLGILTFFINDNNIYAKQKDFPGVSDDLINKVVTDRYCKYNTGTVEDLNAVQVSNMYSNKTIVLAISGTQIKFLSPTKEELVGANKAWDTDWINQYVKYDSDKLYSYLVTDGNLSCKTLYYTESGDDLYILTPDEYSQYSLNGYEREYFQQDVTEGVAGNNGKKESETACTGDKKEQADAEFRKIYAETEQKYKDLESKISNINDANFERYVEEAKRLVYTYYSSALGDIKAIGDTVGCIDADKENRKKKLDTLFDTWLNKITTAFDEALKKAQAAGKLTEDEINKLKNDFDKDDESLENAKKKSNQAFAKWSSGQDNILTGGKTADMTCEGILGENVLEDLEKILLWIRIAVPILIIILGSLDFGKAILADDQKAFNKAGSTFIKRIIAAILVFFAPTIIMYLINAANQWAGQSIGGCDIRGL